MELCNGDRSPVFTVTLPFDPQGQIDAFYNKLYAELAGANSSWSYALVDTSDDVVIAAMVDRRKRHVTLQYEEFSGPQRTGL